MNRPITMCLLVCCPFAGLLAQARRATWADAVLAEIDAKAPAYSATARKIWEFAEVGYQEARSSALLQDQLRAAGLGSRPAGARCRPPSWRVTAPGSR